MTKRTSPEAFAILSGPYKEYQMIGWHGVVLQACRPMDDLVILHTGAVETWHDLNYGCQATRGLSKAALDPVSLILQVSGSKGRESVLEEVLVWKVYPVTNVSLRGDPVSEAPRSTTPRCHTWGQKRKLWLEVPAIERLGMMTLQSRVNQVIIM